MSPNVMSNVAKLERLVHLFSSERMDERDAAGSAEAQMFEQDCADIMTLCADLGSSGDLTLLLPLREQLSLCMEEGDPWGRDIIGDVLGAIAGAEALPDLLGASAHQLGDDQDDLQATIATVMERDPAGSRSHVLELVQSSDPALRATGAWALDYVVESSDLGTFLGLVTDPAIDVRVASAGGVAHLAKTDDGAVRLLESLLADSEHEVRIAALGAVQYHESTSVVPMITSLAADPHARVREWVALALSHLARSGVDLSEAGATVQQLDNDPDEGVRAAAREVRSASSQGTPAASARGTSAAERRSVV